MISRSAVTAALVFAVALSLLAAAPAAAQESTAPAPDITIYRIHVEEDGNATWSVELRRRLTDEGDRRGFERFRDDVMSGNVSVFDDIEREMRPLVEEAEEATGRPMEAVDFERSVAIRETVTGTQGVTRVRFTWTNFAARSGDRLEAGDVFVGRGLTLGDRERLVVEHGDDLSLVDAVPEPDAAEDGELQWNGPRFFEERRPSVALRTSGGLLGAIRGFGPGLPSILGGIAVLLLGFVGGLYIGRRVGLIDGGEDAAAATEEVDDELLTDEDKVVRLLEQHDGRMKQAEIVDSTGWSKSKVSMVLSQMEDDDRISKLRLGRENVIDLEQD